VKTKVQIALGYNGSLLDEVEIIDLFSSETECDPLEKFPYKNTESSGEIGFDNKPFICGGRNNNKECHVYSDGQWKEGPTLLEGRTEAALVQSNIGPIISGGFSMDTGYFSSQELLTSSGWQKMASLPNPVMAHCIVNLNSSHIMSIGGYHCDYLTDVNILDLDTERWSVGPSLKQSRCDHSCGTILTEDGHTAIIVVGGFNGGSSVEILMPGINVVNTFWKIFFWKK